MVGRGVAPVLVTGATGFIGREVVRRLGAVGRPFVVLARSRNRQAAADRLADALRWARDGDRLDLWKPTCPCRDADSPRPTGGDSERAWRR
jgi:nucleoside-diphosphate-sugar epimerase